MADIEEVVEEQPVVEPPVRKKTTRKKRTAKPVVIPDPEFVSAKNTHHKKVWMDVYGEGLRAVLPGEIVLVTPDNLTTSFLFEEVK